jgi:hypothetical protein
MHEDSIVMIIPTLFRTKMWLKKNHFNIPECEINVQIRWIELFELRSAEM